VGISSAKTEIPENKMNRSATLFMKFVIGVLVVPVVIAASASRVVRSDARPTIATEADFTRAMQDVSNWGRWGKDDELGSSNLITPAKRKQAAALVKEGIPVSLAHDVVEESAPDATTVLNRTLLNVSATGSADRYQYTGTYHGIIHSHLDAVDCHVMVDGKGYNGVPMEDVKAAGGCPKGSIHAQRNGIVTRAVLFDATLLPGKAGPQGWLEPGTAIHREDLEALEKIEHVKVSPGDVILLHTGRWKRRAALGAWNPADGYAGYHADVAYFMKERGVAFIGGDAYNDVGPSGVTGVRLPLHSLALVALGTSIFDNLDFGEAADMARRLSRWEFLFTAAPLRVVKGTGSPLNPIATF
jgi:kynurenine formamidase